MARAPGWASGALASGPLTDHGREQVPTPVVFGGSPPRTTGAPLRVTPLGGPHGQGIGRGDDGPSKSSPAVATNTLEPRITPRLRLPLHDFSLRKGRRREKPCYLTSAPPDPDPEILPGGSRRRCGEYTGPEYVRAAPRLPALRLVLTCFPSRRDS